MAAEVGGGRIPIEIEGREAFLEPSLEACIEISQIAGGILGAVQRCDQMDFATICTVIGAGIRVDGKFLSATIRRTELPKSIYQAGVFAMSAKAIEFCHVVANGGKLPEELDDEPDEDESPLASASQTTTDGSTDRQPAG